MLWEAGMKRMISICLFAAAVLICVICLIRLYGAGDAQTEEVRYKETRILIETETTEPEELAESMSIREPYAYLIREKDDFLAVYGGDGITFLFETNIRLSSLDAAVQEKAVMGIPITDEKELYDFLESYSS